jgi:mono/diheme cytochrome c family protein
MSSRPGYTVAIASFLVFGSGAIAQEKPRIEQAPIPRVAASDAKQMFASYCTPCHGKEGRGDGPAAPALKRAPADLTTLSSRNGGRFPEIRVKRYIEGLDEVPAHGTRDMPVWGPLFRELGRDTAVIRIQALSEHLKAMQR